MHIWVDADACPTVIKDILYRVAERLEMPVTLVANQPLRTPASRFIKSIQVSGGFDVADDHIVQQIETGDLVITADIPLAAEVIEKGGHALNPRGDFYNKENIRQRLQMRDFMETMRSSGIQSGGPAPLNQKDRMNFANQLDSFNNKPTATITMPIMRAFGPSIRNTVIGSFIPLGGRRMVPMICRPTQRNSRIGRLRITPNAIELI